MMIKTRAERRHTRRVAKARRKFLRTFLEDCFVGQTTVRPRNNNAIIDYQQELEDNN